LALAGRSDLGESSMSKVYVNYKVNGVQITHHFRPGKNLNDLQFKSLLSDLLTINNETETPVQNKLLQEGLSLEESRELHKNTIICIIHEENKPVGFLLSTIFGNEILPAVHMGLIIVTKNCGNDLIAMSGIGNCALAYEHFGEFYVTNITCTPAIIETFSKNCPDAWPSPNTNLRSRPKDKIKVLDLLEENYINKCFHEDHGISIDKKRFVMSSSAQDMGFCTTLRDLSRAGDFKYQSFSHTWLDYDKDEDIIQIAKYRFRENYLNLTALNFLKLRAKFVARKSRNKFPLSKTKKSKIAA
jgi:hypothetical protein